MASNKEQAIVNTASAIAAQQSAAPSAEQVEQWKKQHGKVYLIEVDGRSCYLRQPNRKDLAAATASGKKDPLKFNDSILVNCWLAGDEEIRTNDELFLGASQVLDEVLEFKTATIKKL
jgi:hypothetical protein